MSIPKLLAAALLLCCLLSACASPAEGREPGGLIRVSLIEQACCRAPSARQLFLSPGLTDLPIRGIISGDFSPILSFLGGVL